MAYVPLAIASCRYPLFMVYVLATGAPDIVFEDKTVGPAVVQENNKSEKILPLLFPLTITICP